MTGVTKLDAGVCRVARAEGPDWVARVFPAARPRSGAATTTGLPEAFVHPDFVPVNAIAAGDAGASGPGLTILDWTNAGRGPRVWSLGFALWAAGGRDLRLVDAFVSRYQRHVTLGPGELAALPMAIAARPLTMSGRAFGAR